MKKLIALLLAVGMVLSLAACGSSSDTSDDTEETTEEAEETEEAEAAEETEEEEETEEAEESESEEEETEESESSEDSDEEPVYGGTLNVYQNMEFSNVYDVADTNSPANYYADCLWSIDWDIDRDIFDYRTNYISSEYMTGQLAESWDIADDYSSMTVYLRDDVYFQDKTSVGMDEEYDIYGGRQMVASDVKYTYDRLLGLDGVEQVELDMTDWATTLYMLESVEVVDDFTVVFNFNTTEELAVDNFMIAVVMICGPEWDELTEDQQNDWHYASGTGPFILTNYVTDNTRTFTKNPDYWDTDSDGNQLPFIDEVNLIYMSDTTTLLSAFIAGDMDLVSSSSTVFDSDMITQIEASLDEDEYNKYVYSSDYQSIGLKQGENPLEPLTDLTVRKAMQYAVDRDAISEFAGYVYEEGTYEEMLSGVWAYGTDWNDVSSWSDELIEEYTTYDPELALEMLEEAGYADGFTMDVTVSTNLYSDTYSLLAEYLADVGITVNYNVVSSDAEMQAVGGDAADSSCVPYPLACSSMEIMNVTLGGDLNYVKEDDDEIDALIEELNAVTTLEDQIAVAKELDQTYMAQHYILMSTYNKVDYRWTRSWVKGYNGETMQNKYTGYMMARLWIDKDDEE